MATPSSNGGEWEYRRAGCTEIGRAERFIENKAHSGIAKAGVDDRAITADRHPEASG